MWGERGYGDVSIPYVWLSIIALLPWLPSVPPQAFPTTIHPPASPPLNLFLHSQQQPSAWDLSTIPKLQLPATMPSRGPTSLSKVCMAAARTVWFSFYLGCHRSAVSLSALNVSLLTQTMVPLWGLDPCVSSPSHQGRAAPVLQTLLFSPLVPSSYQVFHGSIYSFPLVRYSCLLSTACSSLSEGVFLMYPWREMYFMSTYSFAILFSLPHLLSTNKPSLSQHCHNLL